MQKKIPPFVAKTADAPHTTSPLRSALRSKPHLLCKNPQQSIRQQHENCANHSKNSNSHPNCICAFQLSTSHYMRSYLNALNCSTIEFALSLNLTIQAFYGQMFFYFFSSANLKTSLISKYSDLFPVHAAGGHTVHSEYFEFCNFFKSQIPLLLTIC